MAVGFSSALVSWKQQLLLAEPPPLAMKRNLSEFSCRCAVSAYSSICAGRLLPVFFSSHIVIGAICE